MDKRWDILGVGSASVDDLLSVDHYPNPDEKIPVRSNLRQGGGQTATALVAAARQGARAAFCSSLGSDALSLYTIQALEIEGIDCSTVIHHPAGQPVYSIIIVDTSSGSRTILHDRSRLRDPEPDEINPAWVASSRVVLIDQNTPRAALQVARLAREAGVPLVADLEMADMPGLADLLPLVDHLIVGTDFARQITGQAKVEDMLQVLANPQRTVCVVTAGSKGCWYSESGGPSVHIPAIPVQAVDTTGCGDVFHGVYAAAIARGERFARAVRLANASAGLKATFPGGRSGIPDLDRVERYLAGQSDTF